MTIGIYKIEALCPVAKLAGQAIYIGQSINIEQRWKQHRKRFPPDQYEYMVILACEPESLDLLEKLFIDVYDSHKNGLNRTIGGTAIKSRYPDEETKRKQSEAKKGKPGTNRGKIFSEEHKNKIAAARRGKPRAPFSEEHKRKMSEWQKGKSKPPLSEETKQKISEARREYWRRKQEELDTNTELL
jgi:hypothetical protein